YIYIHIYLSNISKLFLPIEIAWKDKPSKRLKLPDILTKLETLYNKYCVSSLIKSGAVKKPEEKNDNGDDNDDDDDDDDDNEDGGDDSNVNRDERLSTEANLKNSMPLEQGIIFHKQDTLDSRKKAWECFV